MKGFSSCGGWKKAPATAYCFLETPALAEENTRHGVLFFGNTCLGGKVFEVGFWKSFYGKTFSLISYYHH